MDILFTLIPLAIVLVFLVLVILAWATRSGQFDNLDVEAERILADDDQGGAGSPTEGQAESK